MNVYHETQLAWPTNRPKRTERKNGPFTTSLVDALRRVRTEVSAFTKARQTWRTNRLTIFLDGGEVGSSGSFLSRSTFRSPAVSVEFDLDGKTYNIAADTYNRPDQNLAGIAAYIGSIRAQERNGILSVAEMMHGFSALPPSSKGWRETFGNCKDLATAETMYRELSKQAHPDLGGSHEQMVELNAAIAQAREELA